MKGFYITMAVIGILLIGAVIGAYAYKTLINYVDAEVADKLDDAKVLQQAGYAPEFIDSNDYALIK